MKRLLYLGLVLAGFLSLTAFLVSLYRSWRLYMLAPQSESTLIYHFSMYIPDNRNSFFLGIIRGAEAAAAELDSAVSLHSIDPTRSELEIAAFTGVDGVIVCPYLDDVLARRQLENLRESQIPAVLINHNLPSEQPWPFIGINNFDMGRRIGTVLAASAPENITLAVVYSDKAPGIYAERELVEMGITASLGKRLSGSITSHRTNLNPLDAEALLAAMFRGSVIRAGAADIPSLGEAETALPGVSGAGTAAGALEPPPAINTIVFTDPEDTIAASQALVDMNLVGKVRIVGFGADPGVKESLEKGIISASVVIDSERIGYEAVHSLAALRTIGYTSASIDTGLEIITGGRE